MTSAIASFGVLVLVIAAIPLVLWLVKRLTVIPGGGQGPLAVAASLSVGPRERIAVVRVEQRWLVVGITAGSINTLAELSGAPEQIATSKPSFRQLLANLRPDGTASTPASKS